MGPDFRDFFLKLMFAQSEMTRTANRSHVGCNCNLLVVSNHLKEYVEKNSELNFEFRGKSAMTSYQIPT